MSLSEELIQDSFHSYLKSSLTQAKTERLLDVDVLSSAEADLMITGPALCLYFAALRCTTDPPSVPLPRSSKSSSAPIQLSYENCPQPFISFLRIWAHTVPSIQSLPPESQHDLARIICGLEPLLPSSGSELKGIAADLRAVAIEISQRRSFQDRYAADLQAALDAGGVASGGSRKASFVPPPVYVPSSDGIPSRGVPPLPSPGLLSSIPHSPGASQDSRRSPSRGGGAGPPPSPGPRSSTPLSPGPSSNPLHSPSLFRQDSPAIEFIRETLYASLADVLERHTSLQQLLHQDRAKAYFASVGLAILDVSIGSVNADGSVIGVLGKRLGVGECPRELRPFMVELGGIGREARRMDEEDSEAVVELVRQGRGGEDIPVSRMDRVRLMLENGVGYEHEYDGDDGRGGRRSVEGRAVAFANRVNALGLALTRLKAFKERQEYVFKVLGGIGS